MGRWARGSYRHRKRRTRSYQAFLDRQWAKQKAQGRFLWWMIAGTIVLALALCVVG